AGSRTGDRDTFATKTIPGFRPSGQPVGCSNSLQANLCVAKRKYPKKRRPGCRFYPALRRFCRGFSEGASCPSENERHARKAGQALPAAPLRADLGKTSGARRGI
ncbi:hypothetical protein, partial [Methylomonas albis]